MSPIEGGKKSVNDIVIGLRRGKVPVVVARIQAILFLKACIKSLCGPKWAAALGVRLPFPKDSPTYSLLKQSKETLNTTRL